MITKALSRFTVLMAVSLVTAIPARAAVTLPDPNLTVDGLPVAAQFDEFISHSTQLLTQFGFSGFNGASGVGGLDVVLMTQAGGIDNDPVSGGFVFEDPVASVSGGCPGCDTFSGTWGAGDEPNGPVLVDQLISYLHDQFDPTVNTPVFTFDLVEPGSAASRELELVANFTVWDPGTGTEIESWSIDAVDNGVFDPAAFVTVAGEIVLTGTSGTDYTASNTGSGKYDFLYYAPTMDLGLYAGQGYEFHIFSEMRNLDGSGEEAFISGDFRIPGPGEAPVPHVPEPGTLTLMGLGLAGFALKKGRTRR